MVHKIGLQPDEHKSVFMYAHLPMVVQLVNKVIHLLMNLHFPSSASTCFMRTLHPPCVNHCNNANYQLYIACFHLLFLVMPSIHIFLHFLFTDISKLFFHYVTMQIISSTLHNVFIYYYLLCLPSTYFFIICSQISLNSILPLQRKTKFNV
jgi:hypothetical protein